MAVAPVHRSSADRLFGLFVSSGSEGSGPLDGDSLRGSSHVRDTFASITTVVTPVG